MIAREHSTSRRLYINLANDLLAAMRAGTYPIGAKLPAERKLAEIHNVSRPIAREAVIALEVKGFVEVRTGLGAFVLRLPHGSRDTGRDITACELAEARVAFEGEAAALAAFQISEHNIAALTPAPAASELSHRPQLARECRDASFHLAVAYATRNQAIIHVIERLINMGRPCPAAPQHEAGQSTNSCNITQEHRFVIDALKTGDPSAAREAMRAHLRVELDPSKCHQRCRARGRKLTRCSAASGTGCDRGNRRHAKSAFLHG